MNVSIQAHHLHHQQQQHQQQHQQHQMSDDDADDANLPTLLKRTPSGSLFIPSGFNLIPIIHHRS